MIKTHYFTLGITKTSTPSEIKKAYYKLAQTYHPDKNPDGGEKFKEISNAYNILSNPESRRTYDATCKTSKPSNFFTQKRSSTTQRTYTAPQPPPPPPPILKKSDFDIRVTAKITLKQAYEGVEALEVLYVLDLNCQNCHGQLNETLHKEKCTECHGRGRRQKVIDVDKVPISRCMNCNGIGYKVRKLKCHSCNGIKTKNASVLVPVGKGIKNNSLLLVSNYGNFMPDNATRGDLFINIVVVESENSLFKRQGDNLYITIDLNLKEALLGIDHRKITTKHMDGSPLVIEHTPGTVITPYTKILQPNAGMPIYGNLDNKKGDLIINFNIIFPTFVNLPESWHDINAIDLLFATKEESEAREKKKEVREKEKEKQEKETEAQNKEREAREDIIVIEDDDDEMDTIDKLNSDSRDEYHTTCEHSHPNGSHDADPNDNNMDEADIMDYNLNNLKRKFTDDNERRELQAEYLKAEAELRRLKNYIKNLMMD